MSQARPSLFEDESYYESYYESYSIMKAIMDIFILSLRSRRQSKAWGGARQRGPPGIWRNQSHQARETGGSRFTSSSSRLGQSLAPASRAGMINRPSYLGFRAAALHPRLY